MSLVTTIMVLSLTLSIMAMTSGNNVGGFGPIQSLCHNADPTCTLSASDFEAVQVFEEAAKLDPTQLQGAMLWSYRKQVVAGLNYLFKAQVQGGNASFVHIKVWKKLDGNVSLQDAMPDQTVETPLEP